MALSRPVFEFTQDELERDFALFNRLPAELQEIILTKLVESHGMSFVNLSWILRQEASF